MLKQPAKIAFAVLTTLLTLGFSSRQVLAAGCASTCNALYATQGKQACNNPSCQDCTFCITTGITNPVLKDLNNLSGVEFLQRLITTLISIGFIIGFTFFFFLLLVGAIRWITAGGDKSSIESAQKTITNALIGLVILLSIFAIIHIIGEIFGVDLLNIRIPTL
jgi:hypothetical protein